MHRYPGFLFILYMNVSSPTAGNGKGTSFYHLLAFLTVVVWGTTFIATKVLIEHGLSPHEIFFLRFLIAYIGCWFIAPHQVLSKSIKDEFFFLLAGLTGGSVYFITENSALGITQTTNVSFIICTTPLLTTLLSLLFDKKEKVGRMFLAGSMVALTGVGLLIFNGSFVLKLSPLGDMLTLCAALSWAFYSIIIKRMSGRYASTFITRKVFFYGVLTVIPYFTLHPWNFPLEHFLQPVVWMNLLFLSVLASLVCFMTWNLIVKMIGTIRSSNYLYLNPLFTTVCAWLVLDERLTVYAVAGVGLVLSGVFLASKK